MSRFVIAGSVVVVLACGQPVPRPDAGVAGGGSAGGGTAGGRTDAGVDAGSASGCLELDEPLDFMGQAGSATYTLEDAGYALHNLSVLIGPSAGPSNLLDVSLYNERPSVPFALPVSGALGTGDGGAVVFLGSVFGTMCDPNSCQRFYLPVRGAWTVTAATQSFDAGTFVGQLSNFEYVEFDFNNRRPVADGGCVRLQSFRFSTRFP